jgi:hypothetical protein
LIIHPGEKGPKKAKPHHAAGNGVDLSALNLPDEGCQTECHYCLFLIRLQISSPVNKKMVLNFSLPPADFMS